MNARRNFIMQYLSSIEGVLRDIDSERLEQIMDVVYDAYLDDRQIFLMGNGGGAATAMHFACDLNKTAIVPGRRRMRAVSLVDNTSLVTAWANDTHYTNIFGEQLINFARPGDVVIGFTASGMSVNIVNAVALANELGCTTVAFVGFDGGTVKAIAQHVLHIPSSSYQHIEDVHLLLCHVVSNALQERARDDEALAHTGPADELQERVRNITYVRQQLAAERSEERRLRMIPEQAVRAIGFDAAALFLVEDGRLRMASGYNCADGAGPIGLSPELYETEAVTERRAILVPQAAGDARVPAGHPAYRTLSSYALAPITVGDRVVGLLAGGFTNGRTAVAGDLQLLTIFASTVRDAFGTRPPASGGGGQ